MLLLEEPIQIAGGLSISDYSITLLVRVGESGVMEGGKYKSAMLPVKGYGSCMVDDYTAIVEVFDKNLFNIEEIISGKTCNVVLTSQ